MRIVCLDIGTKRIGVAASDPLGLTAQPVCVVARQNGREIDEIVKLLRDMSAEVLVVGLPLDAEGGEGAQAKKVKSYAARIEEALASSGLEIPMEFWDERYSTATAEERLIGADLSRARRKEVIDKMAAVVILEDYMRAHEARGDEGARG